MPDMKSLACNYSKTRGILTLDNKHNHTIPPITHLHTIQYNTDNYISYHTIPYPNSQHQTIPYPILAPYHTLSYHPHTPQTIPFCTPGLCGNQSTWFSHNSLSWGFRSEGRTYYMCLIGFQALVLNRRYHCQPPNQMLTMWHLLNFLRTRKSTIKAIFIQPEQQKTYQGTLGTQEPIPIGSMTIHGSPNDRKGPFKGTL